MADIIFTNGSRVFTPQKPPAPSLGDVNGDGEIDILDAAETTGNNLQDYNEDGVIDVLDAALFLSGEQNPGGIIINVPPPTINPFANDKCPPGQYPTLIPIGNGLTTTGCTSIPSRPPTPGIAPTDTYSCDAPKVLGFGIDYETGYPRYEGCICADASVNIADVLLTIGAGYLAWRKALADSLRSQISNLDNIIKANQDNLSKMTNFINKFKSEYDDIQNRINDVRKRIARGDNNLDWNGAPKTIEIGGVEVPIHSNEELLNKLIEAQERLQSGTGGPWGLEPEDMMNLNFWENEYQRALRIIDSNQKILENLQDSLEALLNAADPTALATAYLARLIPINFVVPKECGAYSRLDENCNCVPISSGSYSSLSPQISKQLGYHIVENL